VSKNRSKPEKYPEIDPISRFQLPFSTPVPSFFPEKALFLTKNPFYKTAKITYYPHSDYNT